MKTIELNFIGFFNKEKLGNFPENDGVYCIYSGFENKNNTVTLSELLYIGKGQPLKNRLTKSHDALKDCNGHLRYGQVLLFNYAFVPSEDCARAEAALIYQHNPPENDTATESFNYQNTHIKISGAASLLDKDFTVNKTN